MIEFGNAIKTEGNNVKGRLTGILTVFLVTIISTGNTDIDGNFVRQVLHP